MSNVTSTFRSTANQAQNPFIYNVSLPDADTEVEQALSTNVKQILIRCRGTADLKLAFVSGESATTFVSVPRGTSLCMDGLQFSGSIFIQTNKASQIVEILEWT